MKNTALSGPASARVAHLVYAHDGLSGIRRRRAGAGFKYVDEHGRHAPRAARARIRALVIPPAWTDVWIAADPKAHIQATGRDARGRKQYRYHADWSKVRDSAKFDRVLRFGLALPALRRRVAADLRLPHLSRACVIATVVRLLERTLIRVGNDEYARANGSYGLTTLLDRHARVGGGHVTFRFRAKSGVEQRIDLADAELARRVKECQDLPGQTLFQYLDDDGGRCAVGSADVNAYLHAAMGEEFTAKDFRTWAGTVSAACALAAAGDRPTAAARRRAIANAIDVVAHELGNTRAVCRRCYVHPAILESFLRGERVAVPARTGAAPRPPSRATERLVLAFLRAQQRKLAKAA